MTADEAPSEAGTAVPAASDVGKLELDDLLVQLVERAQDVMGTQSRLRGLLRATRAVSGDLEVPAVLHRIVQAACELVHARYGALGVIGADGGLEQFIHVGVDEQTARRIGHLPEGKGLLGALIDDPRPIRLRSIADDPRSVGFPPEHPPMTSFLGVPIRIRDDVFGNLYLAERETGRFTVEDEELVLSLASTAATAIENARLYDEAGRRQAWLEASGDVTRRLLSPDVQQPLGVIAGRVHELAEADVVTVVLPEPDSDRLVVRVATGSQAEDLTGTGYPRQGTISGEAIAQGRPFLVEDASHQERFRVHVADVLPVGPVMALPLVGSRGARGALVVARLHGRHLFTRADVEMAMAFANHAALALELADARSDRERIALLEDRDRIARDLHDHVIQRLFAAGLSVQSVAARLQDPAAERLNQVIDDIDDTIRQIRTSIFELRTGADAGGGLRARVAAVVQDLTAALGFAPGLTFRGAVDTMASPQIADDVLAVVREALTNVARHSGATRAGVDVEVTGCLVCVQVTDDGSGLGDQVRRSGLANLRTRAERHGGTLTVADHEGAVLTWTVPAG